MLDEEGEDWAFDDDPLGASAQFPGKEILNLASPREVLARLIEDDPLDVHVQSWKRLLARNLLLEHSAVSRRSFARVARAGPFYRGRPPLDVWLRHRFDQSIAEILSEDVEAELQGLPVDPNEHRIQLLSRNFGLEPGLARRACIRINGLAPRVRRAFFRVSLGGETLTSYGLAVDSPYDQVLADVECALRAISMPAALDGIDLPDFPDPTW